MFKKSTLLLLSSVILSLGTGCQKDLKGPHFEQTGDMHYPRAGHTATLLTNGTVLIAGGRGCGTSDCSRTAEIYDPKNGRFNLLSSKMQESHTLKGGIAPQLSDGRVVFIGLPGTHADIYDPDTQTFSSSSGKAIVPRFEHALIALRDDRILIIGGKEKRSMKEGGVWEVPLHNAEIFDPKTGEFTLLKNKLHSPFSYFLATSLPQGDILIIPSTDLTLAKEKTDGAEVFKPLTQEFERLSKPLIARTGGVVLSLSDQTILIVGGSGGMFKTVPSETYDPKARKFIAGKRLNSARLMPLTTVLSTGKIFLGGGMGAGWGKEGILSTAQTYDPKIDEYTDLPKMLDKRVYGTATTLKSGNVLLTGGSVTGNITNKAEIFNNN